MLKRLYEGQELKSPKPVPLASRVWTERCPLPLSPVGTRPSDWLLTLHSPAVSSFTFALVLATLLRSPTFIIKAFVSSQTERPLDSSAVSVSTRDLPALPGGLASEGH